METKLIGKEAKRETNHVYGYPYIITKWDLRFMKLADLEIAQWSKDRSSRVGAVIVKDREIISTGYNGMPRGCDDKWGEGFKKAIEKLREGNVEVIYMEYDAHRQGNI